MSDKDYILIGHDNFEPENLQKKEDKCQNQEPIVFFDFETKFYCCPKIFIQKSEEITYQIPHLFPPQM